jgi:hypothetical protein
MTDEEAHVGIIDDSQPTDEAFWKDTHVVMPRWKESATIRFGCRPSAMVSQRTRLSTAINATLRAYMKADADCR